MINQRHIQLVVGFLDLADVTAKHRNSSISSGFSVKLDNQLENLEQPLGVVHLSIQI